MAAKLCSGEDLTTLSRLCCGTTENYVVLLKTEGCGQDFEFSTSIDLIGVFFLFIIEGFNETIIEKLTNWPIMFLGD